MSTVIPATYRPIREGDINFILNSWMESYREYMCGPKGDVENVRLFMTSPRRYHPQRFFEAQQRLIAELAKRRDIWIACDPENEDFVMGWVCGAKEEFQGIPALVVDYIYVKMSYRKQGLAHSLLLHGLKWEGEQLVATHWTRPCDLVAKRYGIMFDDYLLKMGNYHV